MPLKEIATKAEGRENVIVCENSQEFQRQPWQYHAKNTTTMSSPTTINIVIRLIRSFPYRNIKNMLLKNIDPSTTTVAQVKQLIMERIQKEGAYIPHRTKHYDTLKIYALAQSHKPDCLVINLDCDETQIMKDEDLLEKYGLNNEAEVSFFEMQDYVAFKKNPEMKW